MIQHPKLKKSFLVLCFSLSATVGFSDEASTKILEQLDKINATLARIEERLTLLEESNISSTKGAPIRSDTESISGNLIERVVDAMALREEQVHFPWMNPELWAEIQLGMDPDSVKRILGEPTLEDPSLHKRVDWVFTYRGTRPGTGDKVIAKVKFYKDEVVSVERPK